MKIKCLYNKGEDLRAYENKSNLKKGELGRFGVTEYTQFGLTISKEYLVMGIIIFKTHQAYLIDDDGFISTFPCQLFEIIQDGLVNNWHFRLINKEEVIYPFVQAVFGYPELCYDKKAYENLIVEKTEEAERTYFKRKMELENSLR